jgi:hypothetical protein
MDVSEKKLVSKLAKVMQEVKYIQKRGKNKFHGYTYATEADVNEKVREELAELNVIMLPSMKNHSMRETTTKSGNTEYIVCVDMDFTFVDGETGESLTISMSGEGQDNGDKAIYKAISGCQKYALMKVFMIPTGDDPESDEGVDERDEGSKSAPTKTAPPKQNTTKDQPPATLRAKYQTWHGSMDGYDSWYASQKQKFNDKQIEHWLTKQLSLGQQGA